MGLFEIAAVLIVLTALFSYLNYRTIGLPATVACLSASSPRPSIRGPAFPGG
ncbi:MAG: hypothetical protein IH577_00180 [Deltaproteobacteria bacterium]|nr:hypothetical protein [Deltaproteobacteria bacterium]